MAKTEIPIVTMSIGSVMCDAKGCGYTHSFPEKATTAKQVREFAYRWLNKPCPDCGANLLTEADHAAVIKMASVLELSEVVGPLVGALAIEEPRQESYSVKMKGDGSIKLERKEKTP
jgi:hypothetical protein